MAGTLGLLGCTLPKHLMAANYANEKGYFEPQDIASLHDELLQSIGSAWNDWRKFPSSWHLSADAAEYRERLVNLYRDDYGDAPLSVLKEPRMCRILPLWEQIFADLDVQPAFCFIDRAPEEVAASLQRRDGSSIEEGLYYYIRNHLSAEFATRSRRRVFVSYGDLLADWRRTLARINEALGTAFAASDESSAEIDEFLDPSLRHHLCDPATAGQGPLLTMARSIHAIYSGLSRGFKEEPLLGELDRLRAKFDRLTWMNERLRASAAVARS